MRRRWGILLISALHSKYKVILRAESKTFYMPYFTFIFLLQTVKWINTELLKAFRLHQKAAA